MMNVRAEGQNGECSGGDDGGSAKQKKNDTPTNKCKRTTSGGARVSQPAPSKRRVQTRTRPRTFWRLTVSRFGKERERGEGSQSHPVARVRCLFSLCK